MHDLSRIDRAKLNMCEYLIRAADEKHGQPKYTANVMDYSARITRAVAVEIVEGFRVAARPESVEAGLCAAILERLEALPMPSDTIDFLRSWK